MRELAAYPLAKKADALHFIRGATLASVFRLKIIVDDTAIRVYQTEEKKQDA